MFLESNLKYAFFRFCHKTNSPHKIQRKFIIYQKPNINKNKRKTPFPSNVSQSVPVPTHFLF